MLRTSDLEYELPAGRIAVRPVEPRDAARLMVVDRARGTVEHRFVRDLPEVLRGGDLLVTNESRVLAARFLGRNEATGGAVEGLYLREALGEVGGGAVPIDGDAPACRWVAMLKARRFRPGAVVRLARSGGGASAYSVVLLGRVEAGGAEWVVQVRRDGGGAASTPAVLDEVGLPPIPPYILGARRDVEAGAASEASGQGAGGSARWGDDLGSYQTVFAGSAVASGDGTELGSVAAPTAGLHFTAGLLGRLGAAGVGRAGVVLHVGPGTFKPVEAEFVEQHAMHAEWCRMGGSTRGAIERTRESGGRVVCVGTTSARTVEAFAGAEGHAEWLHTRLLVTPGYAWRWTDGLLTNFHLPRSTLMALVAAMLPGDVGELKRLYAEAIGRGYRFYSYGDAMLVV
ncbi:MAG: S-adenosylmethionine:tRNA ribosyltransferase-isomerase [Phycisphaerales bacterium]